MLNGLPCTIYDVNPPDDDLDDTQEYEEFWSDWGDVEDNYDFEEYQLAIYLRTLKQQVFQERGGFLPSDRVTVKLPYAPRSWKYHPAMVLQAGITTLIVFNLKQNAVQEVPRSDAIWDEDV